MAKKMNEQAKVNLKIVGLVICGLLALTAVVTYFLFGREAAKQQVVMPQTGPSVGGGVGATQEATQNDEYRKRLDELNQQNAEAAKKSGGAAMPTLTPQLNGGRPANSAGAGANEDLPGGGHYNVPPPPADGGQAGAGAPVYGQAAPRERENRARAVMQELDQQWKLPDQKYVSFDRGSNSGQASQPAAGGGQTQAPPPAPGGGGNIMIEKGTMCYAVIESAINTDNDKAMVSGVLASCHGKNGESYNGGRVYGNIERSGESVLVRFNLLNYAKKGYSINAIAFDEKSGSGALSGNVDRHTFVRYWLPAITEIMAGWGQASARENTTTTVNLSGSTTNQGELSDKSKIAVAIGKGGEIVSKILQESLKGKEITVEVPKGVGVGVLFLGDVAPAAN